MCAFGNGSSELCLCKNKQKQKRGNSNKFNILIKHMRITDRGNVISSDSPPDRGRDTMMPVIVKGIVSGRTSAAGASVLNESSGTYGISHHIGAVHQVKNEKSLVPKMYLFISYIV